MAFLIEKRYLPFEIALSCLGGLMGHLAMYNDWKWTLCVLTAFIGPSACSEHSIFEREFWPKPERMYVGRGSSVEHPGIAHVGNTMHLSSKYQNGKVPAWKISTIRMNLMLGV